jgi:hypothetical protein
MELTVEQNRKAKAIMVKMDCPDGFPCYESKFEKLIPVQIYRGANVIRCQHEERLNCQYSYEYAPDIVFCQCPMRRYAALELGR